MHHFQIVRFCCKVPYVSRWPICGYYSCLNCAYPDTVSEEKRCENNDSVNDITYSSHNHSEIHFKAVEDRNTITDHDIKLNDVSGNTNLKIQMF